jgi:predicted alpha/beta hydrolase family esterase
MLRMNSEILICEHWEGRSDKSWLFWLKKKLEQLGCTVRVMEFPESLKKTGNMKSWLPELTYTHHITEDNVHIVSSDPGCLTIFNYVKRIIRNPKSEPTVLIAGKPKTKINMRNFPKQIERGEERGYIHHHALPASNRPQKIIRDVVSHEEKEETEDLDVRLIVMYGGNVPEKLPDAKKNLLSFAG